MIRIEQLDLAFFGHFTNRQFQFSKSDPDATDFHIVYGVNEAGKTTFMEAYLRLLYGFLPRNEPYAFRHGRSNLQVSALLQVDGEMRKFQRNASSRNSLVDEQGNVLPEASLQAHLGGLAMDDYRKLLCIDDDSIDKGGEEIVNSRGDIGTLLFSAAAGISDLWQVLESVRGEAEGIYKSRASKSRLALLKKEYSDVVKQIKLIDIPAGKLSQLSKALKKAESVESKVLDEQRALMVEVGQLGRILNALPMLERLNSSEEAVGKFAHYPEHLDVTSKQIFDLQKEQHQANSERERLRKRQATLQQELEQLAPVPAHQGLEAVIDGLSELHSRYRHAELELENQQADLHSVTMRMTNLVRERLSHELTPDVLVVDAAVIKSLSESLAEREEAKRAFVVGDERIRQLDAALKNEESRLKELEKTRPEGTGLGEILEQYNAQALAAEYKAALQGVREAEHQCEEALDILSIKGHRFTKLPDCIVMIEEVEAQVELWQTQNTTLSATKERLRIEQQELNTLTLESAQLEAIDGLASDQNTQALKEERENAWSIHKESLTMETAEAFEPTLYRVDQAMEGRLAHASDLARSRDVQRRIPSVQGQLDALAEVIRLTEQEVRDVEHFLANVMQQAGINATLPPKAVLAWVRSFHDAQARFNNAERIRISHQALFDKAQKLHEVLSVYIKREQATLDELLPVAITMLEVFKRHEQSIRESEKTLTDMKAQQAAAVVEMDLSKTRQIKACEAWEALVKSSFSVVLDADRLSNSLAALSELRECNIEREALERNCQKMQRDKELFTRKLEQIARDNELEPGETADGNLKRLQELAAAARKHVDERKLLKNKLEQTFADSNEVEKRLDSVKAQSQIFADMFHSSVPTGDLNELLEAAQKTQHAGILRKQYDDDLNALRQTLGVATEENARAMLAELDIPSVQEQQVEKESALELVSERCKEATEKRTRCEEQLVALTGDGEVAQLVERRTTLEIQMSEAAEEYIKLSLGHRLAEQAINRYRDKHRSGMMEATERAFAELTDGKYSKLQTQSNGKEESLLALDKDGTAKRADEMSKGTRFQLYLALRAAAYDQLAEQGTCLPFICDDIFETFDEHRTRAACRVMERIGQRGQAIYLTHHRHVVDLAKEVCGDQVQVHEL